MGSFVKTPLDSVGLSLKFQVPSSRFLVLVISSPGWLDGFIFSTWICLDYLGFYQVFREEVCLAAIGLLGLSRKPVSKIGLIGPMGQIGSPRGFEIGSFDTAACS